MSKKEVEPVQQGPGTDIAAPHYLRDNPHWPKLKGRQKRFVVLWYNAPETGMSNADVYRRAYNRPEMSRLAATARAYKVLRTVAVSKCMRFIDEHILNDAQISLNTLVQLDIEAALFDPRDALDDQGDYLPLHKLPRHVARMVKKAKKIRSKGPPQWSYEWKDNEPARNRLSKHAGYANESTVNVKGSVEGTTRHVVDVSERAADLAQRILDDE
jgi:hypothetical protein